MTWELSYVGKRENYRSGVKKKFRRCVMMRNLQFGLERGVLREH